MCVVSPKRIICSSGGSLLLLCHFFAGGTACAQQLDWKNAFSESSSLGNSTFTEVTVRTSTGATTPDRAVACGHFTGNFNVGSYFLTNPSGSDGVIAFFDRASTLPFDWNPAPLTPPAHASSGAGDVFINDVTLDPSGQFFVTGLFSEDVTFSGSGISLSNVGGSAGFVAWGNPLTGSFTNAFIVPGMKPRAVAVDDVGNIYVTGDGQLARKYPPGGGSPDWSISPLPDTEALTDIALSPDPSDPHLYVLFENSGTSREVVVAQLDRATGTSNWTIRAGGSGTADDLPGGLAVGSDGDPRVAFSSSSGSISYQSPTSSISLPGIPSFPATHGMMLRIDPAGELVWSTPLGTAQGTSSSMAPTNVAVDDAGNAFCSAPFSGSFLIEATLVTSTNRDTAVLGVDAAGLLFDFHRSTGSGLDSPAGVAAPTRDLIVTVGEFTGGSSTYNTTTLPAPPAAGIRAFFAALAPVPDANLFILTPNTGSPGAPTVPQLIDQVHQARGQVYNVVESRNGPLAVSAYLTTSQLAGFIATGEVLFEPDLGLDPDGSTNDSGWALNHLNDATNAPAGSYSYSYADTACEVNVYLIDTAVDKSSGWFDSNPRLTIEDTTLVRGFGDPLVSSEFQHGTEMLSLIGGPDTGAALGTPLAVKNFDFYPNGQPSTASLLADAIYQAIEYHLDFGDCDPGLILISSSGLGSSLTVSIAIDEAIFEGIPVIVSAGNANADAATYLPASDGTTHGVICVGGSQQNRSKESGSNHSTIDLSAPGDAVRVIDYFDPLGGDYASFTGTSAAAALTAGVAATHLSVNPWSTPAELETAIHGDTFLDGGSGLSILQLAPSGPTFTQNYDKWAKYHALKDKSHAGDNDGDGWSNFAEYFHGLKPTEQDPVDPQSWISYSTLTGNYTFSFQISSVLLDSANLGTLRDGGTYETTHSPILSDFMTAPGNLAVGSSTGKQTTLSVENTAVDPECFLRVEVTPSSPSP